MDISPSGGPIPLHGPEVRVSVARGDYVIPMSDLDFISEHGTDESCPGCGETLVLSLSEGEQPCVGCDCGDYLVA